MKNYAFLSLLVVSFTLTWCSSEKDLILDLQVIEHKIVCRINHKISDTYLKTDTFFVEYEQDIPLQGLSYEILSMPLLLNIFSLVWFSGETFFVEAMDKDLYESLVRVKGMFHYLYPDSPWSGEIIPKKITCNESLYNSLDSQTAKKALLFSCGLDSTSSFFHHKKEGLHLITGWGQPDMPLYKARGLKKVKKYVNDFSHEHGVPISYFTSNYCSMLKWPVINKLYKTIYDWRFGTIEAASWVGLTAPIMIAKNCSSLIMGASHSWYVNTVSAELPFVVDCFRFAGDFSVTADQFEMTRADKLATVLQGIKEEKCKKPFIKVCNDKEDYPNNCCACDKCLPLIMNLMIHGEALPPFGFNVSYEEAIKNMADFKRGRISFNKAWGVLDIQRIAKKALKQDPSRQAVLQPIIDLDVGGFRIKDARNFPLRVNWNHFKAWCTERGYAQNIEIPQDLDPECVALQLPQEKKVDIAYVSMPESSVKE